MTSDYDYSRFNMKSDYDYSTQRAARDDKYRNYDTWSGVYEQIKGYHHYDDDVETYKKWSELMHDQELENQRKRKQEQLKHEQERLEKEKVKKELIDTLRESIPAIAELEARQLKLKELIGFSMKMETYSDGLLAMMKEYKENEKKLAEQYKLVDELAKMKLGY